MYKNSSNAQQGGLVIRPLRVGDRVVVKTLGSIPERGTVTELWAGSSLEQMTGKYGLDKYHVTMDNGNTGWFYGTDLTLILGSPISSEIRTGFSTSRFSIGDRVRRIAKGFYPSPKYDFYARPDDRGEGFGQTGTIIDIKEPHRWPPGSSRLLPKLYFVSFDGFPVGTSIGIIEEHLQLVSSRYFTGMVKYDVGEMVVVHTLGSQPVVGKIIDICKGTRTAFGLTKYRVIFPSGLGNWYYENEISRQGDTYKFIPVSIPGILSKFK